jgi:hypothetical protein
MYGTVELELHEFLIFAIDKSNGSHLRPDPFISRELDKNLEDVVEINSDVLVEKQLLEEKLTPSSTRYY